MRIRSLSSLPALGRKSAPVGARFGAGHNPRRPKWSSSVQEAMKRLCPSYYRDMAQVVRGQSTDIAGVATKASQASDALKKAAVLFPQGSGREAVAEDAGQARSLDATRRV